MEARESDNGKVAVSAVTLCRDCAHREPPKSYKRPDGDHDRCGAQAYETMNFVTGAMVRKYHTPEFCCNKNEGECPDFTAKGQA